MTPDRSRFFVWLGSGLVLAVLGSALWDFVFRSVFVWIGDRLVDLTNFGSTALIDSMYVEIAKGNYERASVVIFSMLVSAACGFLLSTAILAFFNPILTKMISTKATTATSAEVMASAAAKALSKRSLAFYSLIILSLLISGTFLVQLARTIYIVRAANHLTQLQMIVAPYISADQRLVYASRASQLETKKDYTVLVDELGALMKSHNLTIPTFNIVN
jgi:hypothetical protein